MNFRKNVMAGILLGIGLPISLLLTVEFCRKDNPNKADETIAFLVFGFTPTVTGGLLARSVYLKHEQQERDRLHAIFYQLLKSSKGRITVLPFAMETKLSGEEAKRYLDEKAKEFDAKYEVDNDGGVNYCFDLGKQGFSELAIRINEALTQELYDVILEAVSSQGNHIEMAIILGAFTDQHWFRTSDLIRSLESEPKLIKKRVAKPIAEFMRQCLENAGMDITLKPSE